MFREIKQWSKSPNGTDQPVKVDRAEGYYLFSDQNKYFDYAFSNSMTLGYGDHRVISAMAEEMLKVSRCQTGQGYTTDLINEVGNFICKTGNWRGITWAVSGTDGVECAIHINDTYWDWREKQKPYIVTFTPTWHGTSHLTKSMSVPGVVHHPSKRVIPLPAPSWRFKKDRFENESVILGKLKEKVKTNKRIGCIVIDPAPWFNGIHVWSPEFWQEIRKICDDYDILMITDDVAAGWGKFGCWHSHEKLGGGIQADISVLGKGLTAGYAPLSAIVTNEKIYDSISSKIFYGHTQKPYIAGIAAVKAVSDIIIQEKLFDKVQITENRFKSIGNRLLEAKKIVSYRAFGSFVGYDLAKDYTPKQLLDYGFSGKHTKMNNLKISAPLNNTKQYFADLEKMLFSLE